MFNGVTVSALMRHLVEGTLNPPHGMDTHSDGLVSMVSVHKNPERRRSSPEGPVWANSRWATERTTTHTEKHDPTVYTITHLMKALTNKELNVCTSGHVKAYNDPLNWIEAFNGFYTPAFRSCVRPLHMTRDFKMVPIHTTQFEV